MAAFISDRAYDGVLALSVADAARAIGVSRATLYLLFAQHEIQSVKIGKRRLVERAELERFLADHRVRRDMADAAEEPAPPTADADQGQRARAPTPQLHRQSAVKGTVARRPRACRPNPRPESG